jgi:hypothetical protein
MTFGLHHYASLQTLCNQDLAACHLKYKILSSNIDRPYGLVVRVPGYKTDMYCDSCEVRTDFIYVM